MKKLTLMTALVASSLCLTGCLMPNMSRLIPENKSAHIMVYNPVYGWVTIDTRVQGDTNNAPLPPLSAPPATPTVTLSVPQGLATPRTNPIPGNPAVLPR